MRTRLTLALALLSCACTAIPLLAQQAPGAGVPSTWQQVPIPALPAFHPQEPTRVELPNGMIIFLQPDHELPLISGTAIVRGGARSEPAAKTGMMDMYGEVWRTGGTPSRTGDQLDEFLENLAAKVETDSGIDSTSISFNCLKADFDPVFQAFVELLQHPAFREDKLALAKEEMDTAIARRNDNIGGVVGRESRMLAYGKGNPYARIAEYATIDAVTRQDLLDWHQRYVHPNNIIFGITGDFDPQVMEARLRKEFGAWEKQAVPPAPKVEFHDPKPGYYFIAKPDVNQSAIQMVTLGTTKRNPDYYAIEVLNEVLSGGFASRLFNTIRSKLGLAYSVGGGIGTDYDHPGIQGFGMNTKSATTLESVRALDKVLSDLQSDPPSQEEMQRAKDSMLNRFIFNFDTPEKVLAQRMRYEFYGYPSDWLERYRGGIEKVTVQDVIRAAERYIHPNQFAVLIVGNPAELGNQIKSLGQVTTLDITIPPPPGQKAMPADARSGADPQQ